MDPNARRDEYDLRLVGKSSTVEAHVVVVVRDWTEGSHRNRTCSITLSWPGRTVEATSESVYHAFQDLREQLEREGLTPDCYGACPDVQCSGMQLDMGDGTYAYRMAGVPRGERHPTVNIFETEPGLSLGTVAQQRKYNQRMMGGAPSESAGERLRRWLSPVAELFTRDRASAATPPAPPVATQPETRSPTMRQSMRRLLALATQRDVPETVEALAHALVIAAQEISVLKSMMREAGVWDDERYRRLKTEAMVGDHNSAGAFPNESHSYYPFVLDEDEYLRFAFNATDADVAKYHAEVEQVTYLT